MNRSHLLRRLSLLSISTLAVSSFSHAEDSSSAIHKKMADFAGKITVHTTLSPSKGNAKSNLVTKPIFRWTNPERKTDVGDIFLWTVNGRPHATLGIWPEGDKHGYEMQSLSNRPFLVEFPDGQEWKQNAGALQFQPLKTKMPPNLSANRRLLEMRQLLRSRFRARLRNWDKTKPERLRLLPNPLFRYGKEKPTGVVDGAVFAFAQGTDPEMLIILEARKSEGPLTWHYAFGSATLFLLDAYLDGTQVWNDRQKFADKTYFMRY